jgi:UDP-N-acetylglucosamine diphosphorylase/glucosamine-1-phosphate N-acetyltransferase
MNLVLFDDLEIRNNLKPLTHTRPIADVRCGIFTMRERWQFLFKQDTFTHTEAYLQELFPNKIAANSIYINASIFATKALVDAIISLQENSVLMASEVIVACNGSMDNVTNMQCVHHTESLLQIKNLWDIFSLNDVAIRADYAVLTAGKVSAKLPATNTLIGDVQNLFIEEGAIVEASVLNCKTGPIYIAAGAEIMENCTVRGPFAMLAGAQLKMAAKIYGATTLGPNCKVGGEVNNAVFFANSSKAHDGFVGNSVIGEWCNMGADSNNSNLKNNYEEVKLWSEAQGSFIKTGLQFCGLIMADHSKCGINTMFNTGTVVGVSCNVFGSGFPRNYIPSFSWGGAAGITTYKIDKALDTMRLVFARRNKILSEAEIEIYKHLAETLSN